MSDNADGLIEAAAEEAVAYMLANNPPTVGEGPEALGSSAAPIPTERADGLVVVPREPTEAHERNLAASNADLLAQALSHPPLSGRDRHLVEVDFPNGMRLTIVREDDYDAVTIWSEDGESIFAQAAVPAIAQAGIGLLADEPKDPAMIAATQQPAGEGVADALDAACCNLINGWQDPYEPREQWEAEAGRNVANLRAAWLAARIAPSPIAEEKGAES